MTNKKESRLGEKNVNYQGCSMRIVQYNVSKDIVVEFQDEYRAKVHTQYRMFAKGSVRNPYYPSVFNLGITGNKCPIKKIDGKITKEYLSWRSMIERCCDEEYKNKHPTYKNVTCCKEWLLYENFYKWIHSQENFEKWLNGHQWNIDKDILVKGNKVYSPETCCLVPNNVNKLFTKCDSTRGKYPIGVCKSERGFGAYCQNPFTNKKEHLGYHTTPIKGFQAYKKYKENLIKQVAQIEYNKGNITERCYKAMLKYRVEITD